MIFRKDIESIVSSLSDEDGYIVKREFQKIIAGLKDKPKPKKQVNKRINNIYDIIENINNYLKGVSKNKAISPMDEYEDKLRKFLKVSKQCKFIYDSYYCREGACDKYDFVPRKGDIIDLLGISKPTLAAWIKKGIIFDKNSICIRVVDGDIELMRVYRDLYNIRSIYMKINELERMNR